jgi:hypothetical protein
MAYAGAKVYKKRAPKKRGRKARSKTFSSIKSKSYKASGKTNRNAISTVAKRVSQLEKKTNQLTIDRIYYEDFLIDATNIPTGLVNGVVMERNLLDFSNWNQSFGANQLFKEGLKCYIKSLRLFFSITSRQSSSSTGGLMQEPMYYTLVVFSPKNALKQALAASSQSQVPSVSTFTEGKEWTTVTHRSNGRRHVFLNPKLFQTHYSTQIAIHPNELDLRGGKMGNHREINVKIPVNMKVAVQSSSLTVPTTANWKNINIHDIKWTKQMRVAVIHGGFNESLYTSGLDVDLKYDCRYTTVQSFTRNT